MTTGFPIASETRSSTDLSGGDNRETGEPMAICRPFINGSWAVGRYYEIGADPIVGLWLLGIRNQKNRRLRRLSQRRPAVFCANPRNLRLLFLCPSITRNGP